MTFPVHSSVEIREWIRLERQRLVGIDHLIPNADEAGRRAADR
jgi:hypothetical protein